MAVIMLSRFSTTCGTVLQFRNRWLSLHRVYPWKANQIQDISDLVQFVDGDQRLRALLY